MKIKHDLFNNQSDILREDKISEKNLAPFINLTKMGLKYNIYIVFREFIKEKIKIKYISNFLIIDMHLKDPTTNLKMHIKKSLYLKNLNMNNIRVNKLKGLLCITIPINN